MISRFIGCVCDGVDGGGFDDNVELVSARGRGIFVVSFCIEPNNQKFVEVTANLWYPNLALFCHPDSHLASLARRRYLASRDFHWDLGY
jgi:hypothetical protein